MTIKSPLKTRFCPSPTGLLHLGNARTALFSLLYALQANGSFLLRIEDTDQSRSTDEFTTQLQTDLQWLGLDWQEGPGKKNPEANDALYFQSKRQGIYDQYYELLLEKKQAYHCFCSEAQLNISKRLQLAQGKAPRYAGTCRYLSLDEQNARIAAGETPVLRLHVPDGLVITFDDLVKGAQSFLSDDIGDFIIRRQDGTAPFMYCNAIDDALMGVTHVLRGEDHLSNTPRQRLILEFLDLPCPEYGHFALILGDDGSPLSKRHGSKNITQLREMGYHALAILNYLARLGHTAYPENQILSLAALGRLFDGTKISRSPSRFDEKQLLFWQKQVIAAQSEEDFWAWSGINVHSIVPADKQAFFIETIRYNVQFPDDVFAWARRFFDEKYKLTDENLLALPAADNLFYSFLQEGIIQHAGEYAAVCQFLKEKWGQTGKRLFEPLRLLFTDSLKGPELKNVFNLMGTEYMQKRVLQVKNHVQNL